MAARFLPSSIGAFARRRARPHAEVTIQRHHHVRVTKVSGELLCDYYAARFGVDTRGLRLRG